MAPYHKNLLLQAKYIRSDLSIHMGTKGDLFLRRSLKGTLWDVLLPY